MITRLTLLLAVLLFVWPNLNGQDTELWTSAEVRYSILDDVRLDFSDGVRLNENASSFKSNIFELGARYRITKSVLVRLAYRYSLGSTDRGDGQRFSAALILKQKWERVFFALRNKYQYDFRNSLSNGSTLTRNKLSIKYDRKKFPVTPVIFGEVFHPFKDLSNMNEWRLGAGLNYDFDKTKSLGVKYFYNKSLGRERQSTRHVIGLGYEWNLN